MKNAVEEDVGDLLKRLGLSIAVAESATGGLISDLITNVPGSSDYFRGSVVAYDNQIKISLLGVGGKTMENYGAVSRQTAEEMAEGVRRLMGVDIGLSDTGIAGPTGALPGKPRGLFYIGLSSKEGARVEEHIFHGSRPENKGYAARAALGMLKEYLSEIEP